MTLDLQSAPESASDLSIDLEPALTLTETPVRPVIQEHDYSFLRHEKSEHRDWVVVNWCLMNVCNYACSYCPDDLHNGKSSWPSYEKVEAFCRKAIEHYAGKKIYFEFTGGEVTLWKDLPKLAKFLNDNGCRVGIISNGSRSLDFWKDFIGCIDHVCLSFHPESAKEEHFIEVVRLCAQNLRTHVNFMMHPEHFDRVLTFAMKVKDIANLSIAVQPLVKDFGEELFPYTDLQKKIIDNQFHVIVKHVKHTKTFDFYRGSMHTVKADGSSAIVAPQQFIATGRNQWRGWSCYAGVEQIVVTMEGDVFRGWCLVGGRIGKIDDPDLTLPTAPVTCSKEYCHCNLDIMTTKLSPRHSQSAAELGF